MLTGIVTALPAQARSFTYWGIKKSSFINFEWTRENIWQALKTRAAFDAKMTECQKGAYGKWGGYERAKRFVTKYALYEDFREHEKSGEIGACVELQQAFYAFREYYSYWQEKPLEWNDNSNAEACRFVGSKNVFTGRCDDVPDWRTDEQRKRDKGKMARIARQRGQDIEAAERLLEAIRNGS